jgi:hypothetical protein
LGFEAKERFLPKEESMPVVSLLEKRLYHLLLGWHRNFVRKPAAFYHSGEDKARPIMEDTFNMEEWEYSTIQMYFETWKRANEKYEEYVATFSDGVRVEGIETLLRRYLDDGGWDLVAIVPTGFRNGGYNLVADTLTVIFRRKRLIP